MGDAPEVVREVGVHDVRVAAEQQLFHLDYRLLGVSPGAVSVELWWKIGFEDRFQHQHRCCHADPIPKDSAPFTFVDVDLPFDTGAELRVERSADPAERLLDAVTPGRHPTTGHEAFDQAFRITGRDQAFASRLLDAPVRQELLTSRLPRLALRVAGRKILVDMDGYATAQAEVEALIGIAVLLADRCAPRL